MLIAHPLTLASTLEPAGCPAPLPLPPRPRRRSAHGALQAVLLALALAALGAAVRLSQAGGATGVGSRCDHSADCPPALVCEKGKCTRYVASRR